MSTQENHNILNILRQPPIVPCLIFSTGGLFTLRSHPTHILTSDEAQTILAGLQMFYDSLTDEQIENINRQMESDWQAGSPDIEPIDRPNTPKRSIVYLLYSAGLYKIGQTTQSVAVRVAELQRAIPHDIEVIHAIKSSDIDTLEAELHERYKAKRGRGEWFHLSPEDVEFIESMDGEV
jgi:hypothetical protein